MNLLVVEDDLHIQKLMISSIHEIDEAIQIFTSTSAVEALKIAKENAIDIFL